MEINKDLRIEKNNEFRYILNVIIIYQQVQTLVKISSFEMYKTDFD